MRIVRLKVHIQKAVKQETFDSFTHHPEAHFFWFKDFIYPGKVVGFRQFTKSFPASRLRCVTMVSWW